MNKDILQSKSEQLLQLSKSDKLVTQWTEQDVKQRLGLEDIHFYKDFDHSELLAFLYQGAGVKLDEIGFEKSKPLLEKSYNVWKTICHNKEQINGVKDIEKLIYMTTTGLLIDKFAEVRMILKGLDFKEKYNSILNENWPLYLEYSIYILFLILIRKQEGWDDIDFANYIIKEIDKYQKHYEVEYFKKLEDHPNPYPKVCWIGALLNILEGLEEYKKYMLTGKPANIDKVIIRYINDSISLVINTAYENKKFIFILIKKTLLKMVKNSLWSSAYGISEKIDEYVEILTNRDKPIFELWPSQREAITKNIFDMSKTALVVQMPTSAGKTLLSKFYILQTLNLYNDAIVAYLVPTRALVNQVKKDLRRDFKELGITVDIAIPFSEIDPLEEDLLLKKAQILVTTPEKLDILVKAKHPIVEKLKLTVIDEAHGLQSKNRGSKLELLLTILRKENRNLRILLLSPFIDNAKQIAEWLGDSRGSDIHVDWKPAQQFTGIYYLKEICTGNHEGIVEYIPSSLNTMYNKKFEIKIHKETNKAITKGKMAYKVAKIYSSLGGVLILCTQKGHVESTAKHFLSRNKVDSIKLQKLKPLLDLIEEEMGKDCLLYECVERGFAFHHSALPLIIREEIESAIDDNLLNPVIATTTLAQGMNFPISTVIFQGMSIPEDNYSRPLLDSEFWNIAGRAGRALKDKEGHIIAITKSTTEKDRFENYLKRKDTEVLSSLLEVLKTVSEDELNLSSLRKSKQLSSLLQYIYHIVLLEPDIEIEDICRGSLVYYQLINDGNYKLAEKLIRITRNYIQKIDKDRKRRKLMEVIDKTGLSSITMHNLMNMLRKNPHLKLSSKQLFDYNDKTLTQIIEIVKNIPEIELSIYKKKEKLNADLVAKITKDWVNGKSIREISNNIDFEKGIDKKIRFCGNYIHSTLVNNLPWGISAIQRAKGILDNKKEYSDNEMLIPSFVYFGVKSKEAVAFSILGVPRFIAEDMGNKWKEIKGEINQQNLEQVSKWLENSTEEDWIKLFEISKQNKVRMAYRIWKKQNGY